MLTKNLMAMGVSATAVFAATLPVNAAVLTPSSIGLSQPTGSNNVANQPYTDDVYLDSLEFGSDANFSSQNSFAALSAIKVLQGREFINAEWGDNDTDSDGDDAPFAKIGSDPSNQETTDPSLQDAALLNVFNSFSLTEMTDGEGQQLGNFQFRALFTHGLTDDDNAVDNVPELIFFERGRNDQFQVRGITGGTFQNPTLSDAVTVKSRDFWASGVDVNTQEIRGSQEIGIGGIDLNALGLSNGETVYGFELTTENQTGPDLNGMFLATENPDRFVPQAVEAVPEPTTILGALIAGGLGVFASKKKKA